MAEIEKTGIIPASNAVIYKEEYKLQDNNLAKYISLDGFKKFHNPGIGLDLSQPSSAPINTVKSFHSIAGASQSIATITGNPNKNGYFVFGNNSGIAINEIAGVVLQGQSVGNTGSANIFSIDSLNPAPNTSRILTVAQSGVYTFKLIANGSVTLQSNNGGFSFDCGIYFKINSNVELISPIYNAGTPSGGNKNKQATINYTINYTKTVSLNQGDYVQIYGNIWSNYNYSGSNQAILNSSSTDIEIGLTVDALPSQAFFTNPQNIQQFTVKGINYYGNNRDTLKLVGNLLTS